MQNIGLSCRLMLVGWFIIASFAVSGCSSTDISPFFTVSPYLVGPNSYLSRDEVNAIVESQKITGPGPVLSDEETRNNMILGKIFIIDRNYHEYESALAVENSSANFLGSVASLGVSTAAATIPVGQTTKILAATVTGITGTRTAFDSDFLKTKTVQTLEAQMRADRAKQAKLIFSRLRCKIDEYTSYFALVDLEAYRQAGTLESALQTLSKDVAVAEEKAEAAKEKPAEKIAKDTELLNKIRQLLVEKPNPCPIPKASVG